MHLAKNKLNESLMGSDRPSKNSFSLPHDLSLINDFPKTDRLRLLLTRLVVIIAIGNLLELLWKRSQRMERVNLSAQTVNWRGRTSSCGQQISNFNAKRKCCKKRTQNFRSASLSISPKFVGCKAKHIGFTTKLILFTNECLKQQNKKGG